MYTFEEIVAIIRQRQDHQSPLMDRMMEIKERYNGDYVIPLPSMEEEPVLPPLTPALISENIDAVAQRAAWSPRLSDAPRLIRRRNEAGDRGSMPTFASVPLLRPGIRIG